MPFFSRLPISLRTTLQILFLSPLLSVCLVFNSFESFAKDHVWILLDRTAEVQAEPKSAAHYLGNFAKQIYESQKRLGKDVKVIRPLRWNANGTPASLFYQRMPNDEFRVTMSNVSTFPNQTLDFLDSKDDLKFIDFPLGYKFLSFLLEDLRQTVQEGELVHIVFLAHGQYNSNPELAWVGMGSLGLNYIELRTLLLDYLKHARIVISGISCYGGGVHTIASYLNNVASSSASPADLSTDMINLNIYKEGPFYLRFWDEISSPKFYPERRSNLFLAHLYGTLGDRINNKALLSSESYLDSVLELGSYSRGPLTFSTKQCNEINASFQCLKVWYGSRSIRNYTVDDLVIPFRLSERLAALASQIDEVKGTKNIDTAVNAALQEFQLNGENYLREISTYKHQWNIMMEDWNRSSYRSRLFRWKSVGREWEGFHAKFHENMLKFFIIYRIAERLNQFEEFFQTASPEQKQKLVQLLQFEWQAI
jgi:hypothetical protein